jgi:hypothetical protein
MAADTTTDEVATWQVISASARGAAHRARGLPNQDAVAGHDGPGGVVAAVADGHGHIRHFRSADGAALAVDVACRVASQAAAGLADAAGYEEAERAGQELARAVVADWRSAVAGQLEVRPYTVEERFLLDRSADMPVIPYGSTLLVAVIAARWLVCAQIGDGDMLAVRPAAPILHGCLVHAALTARARQPCRKNLRLVPPYPPRSAAAMSSRMRAGGKCCS